MAAAPPAQRSFASVRDRLLEALVDMQWLDTAEMHELGYEAGAMLAELFCDADFPIVCPVCDCEVYQDNLLGTRKTRPWWYEDPAQAAGGPPPPPPPAWP